MESCSDIIKEDSLPGNLDYEKIKVLFDNICSEIATLYSLYYSNGEPCKAKIIEVTAGTTCTSCMDRKLREKKSERVDSIYRECHQLACNILVEELHSQLNRLGYSVLISREKNVEYGKVDVLISLNGHGISLHCGKKEVAVEVKTGLGLSLSQLFRYMLDNPDRSVVLWRIRNKQILIFEGTELKPLLVQFIGMLILRGQRFLANSEISCEHTTQFKTWSPTQEELQEMFSDFAQGVVETLPSVVKAVVENLDIDSEVKRVKNFE